MVVLSDDTTRFLIAQEAADEPGNDNRIHIRGLCIIRVVILGSFEVRLDNTSTRSKSPHCYTYLQNSPKISKIAKS
jgi:hypothetical protein